MKRFIYKITLPFFRAYWKIFKPKTQGSRGIILHGNTVLLTKNINTDYWSLPGGKIDGKETPEQCLTRELKEELDLNEIGINSKLGEYTSEKEGKRDTVHVFIVTLASSRFQKQWELEDAKWFDLNELPTDVSPATLRRINEYQQDIRGEKSEKQVQRCLLDKVRNYFEQNPND